MLKVVVFDCGYGGEFFADRLQDELPVIEIIRVIDWRNADKFLKNPKSARKAALDALRPYIGRVDLIVFANHLLAITSLKYFRRKYKQQKFVGFKLKTPDSFVKRDVLVLTTRAVTRTISYRNFMMRLRRRSLTLSFDDWPLKIDDGELTEEEIKRSLNKVLAHRDINPQEVILACSQFDDIKVELRNTLGQNLRIYDSFGAALREVCKILRIRGRTGRKIN